MATIALQQRNGVFYAVRAEMFNQSQLVVAVNDYMTKLCRQKAEVILNHDNENVRYIGQGEGRQKI
jgi:hypothetical protein